MVQRVGGAVQFFYVPTLVASVNCLCESFPFALCTKYKEIRQLSLE